MCLFFGGGGAVFLFCYVNSLSSPSNWIVDSLCLECCLSVPYGGVENAVTNISHSVSSTEIPNCMLEVTVFWFSILLTHQIYKSSKEILK